MQSTDHTAKQRIRGEAANGAIAHQGSLEVLSKALKSSNPFLLLDFLGDGFMPMVDESLDACGVHGLEISLAEALAFQPTLFHRVRSRGDNKPDCRKRVRKFLDPLSYLIAPGFGDLINTIDHDHSISGLQPPVYPTLGHGIGDSGRDQRRESFWRWEGRVPELTETDNEWNRVVPIFQRILETPRSRSHRDPAQEGCFPGTSRALHQDALVFG